MHKDSLSNHSTIDPADLKQEPIERAKTIPSRWYTSEQIYRAEQDAIFSKYWQLVCHKDQLKEPGDMVTLDVAGNPVLVVKSQDGDLRAFYNVCKHRGGPVAVKKGTTTVLQCKYHGWTYLTDGSLRGVPHFNKVDLFDKKDFGLEPISLKCYQDLVFISLTPIYENIEKYLEGISNLLPDNMLNSLTHHSDYSYQINCNWKVYVDNFLEGYHIPIVHPELAKALDYNDYQTDTYPWWSVQHSPLKGESNLYKETGQRAYYIFIFPNIMLNILPGRLQTNIIRPLSPDKTEVVFSYYYEDVASTEAQQVIKEDISYSHQIQVEDVEICELVQKGLRSNAYDQGRFSVEREQGVYHFQSMLKKAYGDVRSET